MALTLHNYVQSAAYKRILAMRADLLDAKLDVGFVGEEGDYELYRRFEQEKARLFFVDLSRGSYMERITERALLIVPFFLFAASVEDKDKLAKLIHKVAGCFLADYRLPERNLDYPFFG